jgi:hypothetical protein
VKGPVRLLAAGCLVVLATVGASLSSYAGQPAPSITVDAAQYAPGATVTFTASGFVCNETPVVVTLDPGGEIGSFPAGAEGMFSGTFTAPSEPGTYELVADGQATDCIASTSFEVVVPPSTTEPTTTTSTTTSTTTTTTAPAETTTTTTLEVTTTSAAVTTTAAASGAANTTTSVALPATGLSGTSMATAVIAIVALSAGLILVVATRRKPS